MNTQTIFSQSELALAAYANLNNSALSSQKASLKDAGFSDTQADTFATHYAVVSSCHDANSSFDATVFKDVSGNLTLAIRGTLEVGDFAPTDGLIVARGVAYNQAVAMWNWWQRVSNPSGTQVAQYRLTEIPSVPANATSLGGGLYLELMTSVPATGDLLPALAADSDHKLDITGHSLGGHLAMAFNALFPSVSGNVVVFNAPGFLDNGETQRFFTTLGGTGSKVPAGVIPNVTNVIADEANVGVAPWSAIAGLHSRPGTTVDIAIENQFASDEPNPPGARNHSQQILTDSLAVYALLNKMDTTLSTTEFKSILNASAAKTSASLERIVDALETLFGINNGDLTTGNNNRDSLYQAIYALPANPAYQALAGQVTIELSTSALGTQAKSDFSALVSLLALSPIVLKGSSALLEEKLGAAWGDVFSQWQSDANLTAEQRAAGEAHYSDAYLADRAAMLTWKLKFNTKDIATSLTFPHEDVLMSQWQYFKDYASGQEIVLGNPPGGQTDRRQILFGSDAQTGEVLTGQDQNDRIYAGAGADILVGGQGNDYLEGNADNDNLTGGKGNDVLYGGAGSDTYKFTAGDGWDTLTDSDGIGRIELGGTLLDGGKEKTAGSGVWYSADNKIQYALFTEGDGSQTLNIVNLDSPADRVFVKNYRADRNLGLVLENGPAAVDATTRTILGDKDYGADGSAHDDLGNPTGNSTPGSGDYLQGGETNDHVQSLGGDDKIKSKGGDDLLEGGTGSDILDGGAGDWLSGEGGNDRLVGPRGNDALSGQGRLGRQVEDASNEQTWREAA